MKYNFLKLGNSKGQLIVLLIGLFFALYLYMYPANVVMCFEPKPFPLTMPPAIWATQEKPTEVEKKQISKPYRQQ